jgi:quercetin dioxygenase-like cupin family protein
MKVTVSLGGAALVCCLSAICTAGDETSQPAAPKTPTFRAVAIETHKLVPLPYDAGLVKFIATSKETAGTSAVVELTEMPGYKTAWHQHNNCEEAFYVLEGTLTIRVLDKTYTLPEGSYVLIPRGTPHGQGNFTSKPVRLLTTFTPGGFEEFFLDRVALYKSIKPGAPTFQAALDELRAKHRRWVQILGTWDVGR